MDVRNIQSWDFFAIKNHRPLQIRTRLTSVKGRLILKTNYMDYNKIYLKVTSLPQTENLQTDSLEFELFKDKYNEARNYVKDSDVLHSYENDSSKTPSFARIYSLTVGMVDEGKMVVKIVKGEEKDILQNLLNTFNDERFKKTELVCFNLGFNLGFLTTRMLKNGISTVGLPVPLRHLNCKPWQLAQNKGLSEHFSGSSWWRFGFEELCFTAGIPIEGIIDGADVYTYYKGGKIDEIDNSDYIYLQNLINLDRISEGKETLSEAELFIQSLSGIEEAEDTRTVLEKLYDYNEFTEELQEEVKKLIGKNKLTAKDKKNLFTILRGVVVKCDFVNGDQDSKATIKEKEEEINQFIESL